MTPPKGRKAAILQLRPNPGNLRYHLVVGAIAPPGESEIFPGCILEKDVIVAVETVIIPM
jgi:hypothetical protein